MRIQRSSHSVFLVFVILSCLRFAQDVQRTTEEIFAPVALPSEEGVAATFGEESFRKQLHMDKELNRLYYMGGFGLGHRLSKMSGAFDLASRLGVPIFEVTWGTCGSAETEIFAYLFGSNVLRVPSTTMDKHKYGKMIVVDNDATGYYAAQSYKNGRVPLSDDFASLQPNNLWTVKLNNDFYLFRTMLRQFKFREELENFQVKHRWADHYVIGLHIRAGNGETGHFVKAGRGIQNQNQTQYFQNLGQLLLQLADRQNVATKRPPLLFLATDTADLIPIFRDVMSKFNISSIAFPQHRLNTSGGVTYNQWQDGQICLKGWKDSVTDMILLSQANTVVAARYSTLSQIFPLSIVFGREEDKQTRYRFCEVSTMAHDMSCFGTLSDWLFRRKPSRMGNFTLDKRYYQPVVHQLTVHLPDLEYEPRIDEARSYLRNNKTTPFKYCPRYNIKYRGKKYETAHQDWELKSH